MVVIPFLLTPGFPDLQSLWTSPQPSSPGEEQVEPPEEPPPKPSKRLIILAECMWASDNDRNLVLKELCERMACDQLDKPFWVRQYFISPVAQTAEGSGTDCCIQYKIHISTPKLEPENPAASRETAQVCSRKHFLSPQVSFPGSQVTQAESLFVP